MVATIAPRTESPARWAKALQRAVDANPVYLELAGGDGAWAVGSTQNPELGYVATAGTCTCEAGRAGDPVCLHRALVRALLGILPDPAPAAVAAPTVAAPEPIDPRVYQVGRERRAAAMRLAAEHGRAAA